MSDHLDDVLRMQKRRTFSMRGSPWRTLTQVNPLVGVEPSEVDILLKLATLEIS